MYRLDEVGRMVPTSHQLSVTAAQHDAVHAALGEGLPPRSKQHRRTGGQGVSGGRSSKGGRRE